MKPKHSYLLPEMEPGMRLVLAGHKHAALHDFYVSLFSNEVDEILNTSFGYSYVAGEMDKDHKELFTHTPAADRRNLLVLDGIKDGAGSYYYIGYEYISPLQYRKTMYGAGTGKLKGTECILDSFCS